MINSANTMQRQKQKYLRLLAEKYPTKEAVYADLINLQASLCLPKSVEHFVSDLHGEYELFYHILNNCSGVIKEKVDYVFGARLTDEEKAEFCTLIYYPVEKIQQLEAERRDTPEWYRENLSRLLEVSKLMTYKYPLTKVKSFIPQNYRSVITELFNTHPEADRAQFLYSKRLLNMIVQVGGASDFIVALTSLIKCLAVGHMHIIGDFFDRGNRPDTILDMVQEYHSLDIQWGNHDILWMGAAAGNDCCIANVVRGQLRYGNQSVLEDGYGINMLPLATFALDVYGDDECVPFMPKVDTSSEAKRRANLLIAKMHKAISIIQFKLEAATIMRRKEFDMESRLLLDKIDFEKNVIKIDGVDYKLTDSNFPTVDPANPYQLTEDEQIVVDKLHKSFKGSEKLKKHMKCLFANGCVYAVANGNLLYHASMPLNADGTLKDINIQGELYHGKALLKKVGALIRSAYFGDADPEVYNFALDYIWYLWCGKDSPVFDKDKMATFERYFIEDKCTHKEIKGHYYTLRDKPEICDMILDEFGIEGNFRHIINGHVPVLTIEGENPVKAGGKLMVIDGGFSKAYQPKTGIAGYTLVYHSRGFQLVQHEPFTSITKAVEEGQDIKSTVEMVEMANHRMMVKDTDKGAELQAQINDLKELLLAYRNGDIKERDWHPITNKM